MIWDKWIPAKYLVKQGVCVVEACHSESGVTYYYTHIKTRNNKLELAATGSSEDTLQLPASIAKNKVPVLLVINGKGVILKKVDLPDESNETPSELTARHLPTINSHDFYIQVYRQDNGTAFMALCRKELVTRDAEAISAAYDLAGVQIGAAAITGLKPLWGNFNSIATSLHTAELTNGFLDTLTPSVPTDDDLLQFDGLQVPAAHALGFATGLNYLLQLHVSETDDADLLAFENKHYEKNKFRFLITIAIAAAFLLAITNVMFYTSYFDKNNKLETELSVYQGKYEKINELLNDYQKNRQLIENTGILNKNRLSEYGDRIGKTIPREITLSELYFNPKKESDSEDSLVTFRTNYMVLKGSCPKSFIVNEWVNVLKMQKFIKAVNLEKYTYNNEGLLPNFEITLVTE